MERSDRSYIRPLRYALQWGILLLTVYAGFKLYLFLENFRTGGEFLERPPMVDGFLPIGGLMGLKLWMTEGIFDPVHPAAIVIFVSAVGVSALFKKSFCGWLCPVGTLSDAVFKTGRRLLGKNYKLPSYVDYPLRSLKYLLLGFFLYVVGRMSSPAITAFFGEPYWKVADIKMLRFFTGMSALTAVVLAVLFIFSLFFKNFWCRYLCPYGALLGLLSLLSPFKITRNEEACTHCGRCTKNCPSSIPVERKQRVRTPECTGCLTCVSVCPSKSALDMGVARPLRKGLQPVKPLLYISLLTAFFFGVIAVAKLTGHWHSSVTHEEYKAVIPMLSGLAHP